MTLLVLATWLVWAVTAVNIDFDDGYAAFANSAHFLGQSPVHFYNRAPLLGIMLMPVKLLSDSIGLHPLDVRGAHALMALILIAYLVGTWRILARAQGSTPWSLVAFAAAVPTPVFFSYAPFLNIDIFQVRWHCGCCSWSIVNFQNRGRVDGGRWLHWARYCR
ncbi:MAG: hypothetical protein IPG64_21245 [Haliea sp.]|nr:hypothetical protein [Haliea sp.]